MAYQSHVVVVGGGMTGLTAAAYLARAGLAVTVYEKAAHLGGKAATQVIDGYSFNRGIHALYTGGATERVLGELAVPYSGHSPKGLFVLRDGKLHVYPYDALSMLRSGFLSLADKLEFARVFGAIPNLDYRAYSEVSVLDWLEDTFHRPDLLQFMKFNACTLVYSSALHLVSADVLIQKIQIALHHPVIYIDGGWQTLVEGLRAAAERGGARVVSGTRVEAVDYHDGRVQGVRLRDQGLVEATAVVIATNPQDAVRLVDAGQYPALRQIVDALLPPQLACLDVALSRLPDPQHPIAQDMENPRFMSAQSLFSRVAPEGGALIYSFKQLDPTQTSDPHEDERDLEDLLDTVQPGWREVLVKRQYLPRIEALGTLPQVKNGGFVGRPDTHVPGIDGLYLAGDWIGAEGFLSDASTASASLVAQQIIQREPLVIHSAM